MARVHPSPHPAQSSLRPMQSRRVLALPWPRDHLTLTHILLPLLLLLLLTPLLPLLLLLLL